MRLDAGGTVTVDLDGMLVLAHSEKEDAAPTWTRSLPQTWAAGSCGAGL